MIYIIKLTEDEIVISGIRLSKEVGTLLPTGFSLLELKKLVDNKSVKLMHTIDTNGSRIQQTQSIGRSNVFDYTFDIILN